MRKLILSVLLLVPVIGFAESDFESLGVEASSSNADPVNEVIKEQVADGLRIVRAFQDAVAAAFYSNGHQAPVDRTASGLTANASDTATNYITSLDVQNGTIVITYGGLADDLIDGETLTFTPYESVDLTLSWRCGNAPVPPGAAGLAGAASGGNVAIYIAPTIPNMFLPGACTP